MKTHSRRRFLSNTIAAGAGASMVTILPGLRAAGSPNDAIQIGLIGIGWKGGGLLDQLLGIVGVRIVALCDADKENLAKAQSVLKEKGLSAKEYVDMRHLFDDASVDAVVIATPNHWHALATVWACQAGKDVYVEKPVSHNLWEGRKMVEAARKYNRIVQAGTQNRSDNGFISAIEHLKEGHLGEMLWTHGLWYKNREVLEHVSGPQPVPPGLDYDLWTGPAPLKPLMRKNLHYDWHWNWDTGDGDFGNLGAHKMDDSINVLGTRKLPDRFLCVGGLFNRDDGWETPNVQTVFLEFGDLPPVTVEVRSLPPKAGAKYEDHYRQIRRGSIVQCEGGYFAGGRGGGIFYDNDRKKIKSFPGDGGKTHMQNWLDAIRTRDRSTLMAEIELGIISANICHISNLAYRSGLPASSGEVLNRVGGHAHAVETVQNILTNLKANNVDLDKTPLTCSEWMQFDSKKMQFFGGDSYGDSIANELAKPRYRAPYVVPDKV